MSRPRQAPPSALDHVPSAQPPSGDIPPTSPSRLAPSGASPAEMGADVVPAKAVKLLGTQPTSAGPSQDASRVSPRSIQPSNVGTAPTSLAGTTGAGSSPVLPSKFNIVTSSIRSMVSKNKRRYKDGGYDLDLSYITENLIAMGYPAKMFEGVFRNRMEDIRTFLQERHPNHYKVYNLCSEPNRHYNPKNFQNRLAIYRFDDHHPPQIMQIFDFCIDVNKWLNANPRNVCAIHCKAGKGRTGVMICCYLLWVRKFTTADTVLDFYGNRRTKNGKGVTIPSQRRYVHYFATLADRKIEYHHAMLTLDSVRLQFHTQAGESPHVFPFSNVHFELIVLSAGVSNNQEAKTAKTRTWDTHEITREEQQSACVMISTAPGINLSGDVRMNFYTKPKMKGREELFHLSFNTFFATIDCVEEWNGSQQGHGTTDSGVSSDSNPEVDGSDSSSTEPRSKCICPQHSRAQSPFIMKFKKKYIDKVSKDHDNKIVPPHFELALIFRLPSDSRRSESRSGGMFALTGGNPPYQSNTSPTHPTAGVPRQPIPSPQSKVSPTLSSTTDKTVDDTVSVATTVVERNITNPSDAANMADVDQSSLVGTDADVLASAPIDAEMAARVAGLMAETRSRASTHATIVGGTSGSVSGCVGAGGGVSSATVSTVTALTSMAGFDADDDFDDDPHRHLCPMCQEEKRRSAVEGTDVPDGAVLANRRVSNSSNADETGNSNSSNKRSRSVKPRPVSERPTDDPAAVVCDALAVFSVSEETMTTRSKDDLDRPEAVHCRRHARQARFMRQQRRHCQRLTDAPFDGTESSSSLTTSTDEEEDYDVDEFFDGDGDVCNRF